MIMSLMTFSLSFVAVSLVMLLSRLSVKLAKKDLPEAALLRTAIKGGTAATIAAMYIAYRLVDGDGKKWAAILAVSAGLLVMLVAWEKRRRLLVAGRAR